MAIQTVDIGGEGYVIMPEKEFRVLQRNPARDDAKAPQVGRKFREVIPLKVKGISASEMLIRDRR